MMRHFFLNLVFGILTSCTESDVNIGFLDGWLFENTGSYMFGSAPLKTLKDVHLEGSGLLNSMVVTEGYVEKVGDQQTYIILTDPNARLLIEMTSYYELPVQQTVEAKQKVRVLGRIKTGRKGLPYLSAYAMRPLQTKAH